MDEILNKITNFLHEISRKNSIIFKLYNRLKLQILRPLNSFCLLSNRDSLMNYSQKDIHFSLLPNQQDRNQAALQKQLLVQPS